MTECRSDTAVGTYLASTNAWTSDAAIFSPPGRVAIPPTLSGTNLLENVDYILLFADELDVDVAYYCTYSCTSIDCANGIATFDQCYQGFDPIGEAPLVPGDVLTADIIHVSLLNDHVPPTAPLITVTQTFEEIEPCAIVCSDLDDFDACTLDRCIDDGMGGLVADHVNTWPSRSMPIDQNVDSELRISTRGRR